MKEFKTITFEQERPKDDQLIFCILDGDLHCLKYQSLGYPLYCPIADDTCSFMLHDFWLKEVENEQ